MNKRIDTIDILKGITIILVVFGHAVQGIVDSNNLSLNTDFSSIYITKQVIYGFHMPVFFIVSGFFLTKWLKKDKPTALKKKTKRLVYPYFVWSFITALFMQIASKFTNNGLGLIDFVKSPVIPFSQYWFLYLLFFFHLVYFVVDIFFNKKSLNVLFCISIGLFCIGPFLPDVWVMSNFTKYFIFFMLGSYVLPYIQKEKKVGVTALLGMILLFIVVNYLYVSVLEMKYVRYYLFFITSIVGFILSLSLSIYISQKFSKLKGFMIYLGKNSMQLYVMHLIPLAGLRIVLLKLIPSINLWGLSLLIAFLSLIICLIGIKIINKLNLEKILF